MLGPILHSVPIYGSGGFTSYSECELCAQLAGWVDRGIPTVKTNIGKDRGTSWQEDVSRMRAARDAIGDDAELFVDANGAYDRKQARPLGCFYAEEFGVTWFEEPVTSDDRDGLASLRRELALEVSAGEYGCDFEYFRTIAGGGIGRRPPGRRRLLRGYDRMAPRRFVVRGVQDFVVSALRTVDPHARGDCAA